jgi:hypothetical protein
MMSKDTLTANPLIYNITLKIHQDLAQEWLVAMKENFLPKCTDGEVVVASQINQVLVAQDDEDLTFAVQFIFSTKEIFETEGMVALRKFVELLDSQFLKKYVYFTTKMEILHSLEVPSEN